MQVSVAVMLLEYDAALAAAQSIVDEPGVARVPRGDDTLHASLPKPFFDLQDQLHVVVTARNAADVKDFAQKDALVIALDVTDKEQIDAAVKAAEDKFEHIDVFVNNAGIGYFSSVEEGEDAQIRRVFEVNVFGLNRMIQTVLPGMRERQQGFIVNFSSIGGLRAFPALGDDNASKFAVEGLSEALWQEVEPLGIKVMLVEPSGFRTDWAGRSASESKNHIADYARTAGANLTQLRATPGKQPGDPARGPLIFNDLIFQGDCDEHLNRNDRCSKE